MMDHTREAKAAVARIVACNAVDHYGILGLEFAAERPAIIKAYQRLSLLVHPDKCGEPDAENAMKRLNNTKEYLTNPDLKAEYDLRRANGGERRSRHDTRESSRHQRHTDPPMKPRPRPYPPETPRRFGEYDRQWKRWEQRYREQWKAAKGSKRGQKMPSRVILTDITGQPDVEFDVITTGKISNSFWRAFALAYHFDVERWAEVKVQVSDFFIKIASDTTRSHPRRALYDALNKQATKQHSTSLIRQLTHANEKTTPELYQVIADLFSVELLVVHDTAQSPFLLPRPAMVPRGQNGHRQIFLQAAGPGRYHTLRIRSSLESARWYAHMGGVDSDKQRCPLPGWGPDGEMLWVPEVLDPLPKLERVDLSQKARRWSTHPGAQK